MYSLLVFLGAACMLAYTAWLERPRPASAAALVGTAALAYLTHYFALFLPLVQFLHLALHLRRNPRALRAWAALQAFAALPLAGWILVLSRRDAQIFGIGWIPVAQASDLFVTLVNFTSGVMARLEWWQVAIAIACLLLAVHGVRRPWDKPHRRSLALLWAAAPPLIAFSLSIRRPVYMDRFLLISLPAVLLLVAHGLARLPRPAVAPSAALLVALTGLAMVRFCYWPGQLREQWREASDALEQAGAGEAIIARVLQIVVPLSYYYHDSLPLEAMEVNRVVTPLSELARGHDGVWLVYWNAAADIHRVTSTPSFRPEEEQDAEAASWLAGHGPPLLGRVDFVGVTLFHFGAPP
jgi:mannosyltransferase